MVGVFTAERKSPRVRHTSGMRNNNKGESQMKKILMMLTLAVGVAQPFGAFAEEHATKEQAKAMAEKAAAYVEKNGVDAAVKAFTKPAQPEFIDRDLYVFMYKPDGTMIAHGAKPQIVGSNRLETKDAEGKFYVKEFMATKVGEPRWVDYMFPNPVTNQVEPKTTYIIHVGKPDVIVGVGAYKQ